MKRQTFAASLAALLFAPALQAALTVTVTDGPGTTGGGEFNAALSSGPSFITFCLERGEFLSFGTPFNVTFNNGAVTGAAAPGSDSDGNAGNGKDVIKKGTAYLYSQMLANTLTGYAHTDGPADDLQKAIWYFEGEMDGTEAGLGVNQYLKDSFWALQSGFTDVDSAKALNSAGGYGIWVMNLTADDGNHQDLLAPVPEPSTVIAGALLLLPFAASTLRTLRKNRTV